MAEKRQMNWIEKLLLRLVLFIVGVAVVFFIAYIVIKQVYNIDLFVVYGQLSDLRANVQQSEIASNVYSDTDKTNAIDEINGAFSGSLISGNFTDGYSFNSEATDIGTFDSSIMLSGNELCAVLNIIIANSTTESGSGSAGSINLMDYDPRILEIDISGVADTTNKFDVTIYMRVSLSTLKEQMKSFPVSLFKGLVPDYIYIVNTSRITKGDGTFNYAVESVGMRVNKLDFEATKDLYNSFNTFFNLGEYSKFTTSFSNTFINIIIGNSSNTSGLAYSIANAGGGDFNFTSATDIWYYVIQK